ncbi:MAG: transcription antitermination factor NusB [Hyphomonadaceae bacterium]
MSGARSRLAAAEVLMCVLEERRTLDEAMVTTKSYALLKGPDRGFARAMASAALRQLGRINAGLAPFLSRPIETATPPSRALLQVGAAQIWLMETAAHAAVGETVAAAKLWPRARKAAGFLNAVLRKAASDRTAFDAAPAHATWPDWLSHTMFTSLGDDTATALAAHQQNEPSLQLTAKGDPESLLAEMQTPEIQPILLPNGSLQLPTGQIETLPLFENGDWWVQDAGASLPAKLIAAQSGQHIVDLCAAPGGKTMQLAATGARVTAIDRSKKRLVRLSENLERTKLGENTEIEAVLGEHWTPDAPVDAVLVDAPCSALGTLRRHPEGAWIKHTGDVAGYPAIQARLLDAAIAMTKPGGIVVYCVCSPLPIEGREIVEAALKTGSCTRTPILPADVPGFADRLTPEGDLLTLPGGEIDSDIFYIAKLKTPI